MAKAAQEVQADPNEPLPDDKNLPAEIGSTAITEEDFNALYADAGKDAFESQDVALPFIQILQALSPQVDESDGAYVPGAKPGMFINTATNEMWDGKEGIDYIPVKYERRYTEWTPRNKGGGLVKDWGTDSSKLDSCHRDDATGRDVTPEGTEVIGTGTFYGLLVLPDKPPVRGVMGMQATQFKKARKWNALITSHQIKRPDGNGYFTPAMFARVYHVTSVKESNDQGNWFGFKVDVKGDTLRAPNGKDLYLMAREFRALIDKGVVEVAPPPQREAGSSGGSSIDEHDLKNSEEIPF
jgi:hypothetical protein